MYCIESGESGTYLAYDLHKRPHYQYNVQDRSRIEKEAKEKGIGYRFSNKSKFVEKDNLYHYTNESEKYKVIMNPLVEKFELDHLADMMIDVHKNQSKKITTKKRIEVMGISHAVLVTLHKTINSSLSKCAHM